MTAAPHSPGFRSLISWGFGLLLTFGAIAFVLYGAWGWERAATMIDSTLLESGERSGPPPGPLFTDADGYVWLNYARRIGAGETWRVRFTHNDNAPYGRPQVAWSQSISWMLVALGKTRQVVTGESWQNALDAASVWLGPLLLLTLVGGITVVLIPRIGPLVTGIILVLLVTLHDVILGFHPLRPDHQSVQMLFTMLTVLGLLFADGRWKHRPPPETKSASPDFARSARGYFLLSGISLGLLLWVGAVTALVVVGLLFVGFATFVFLAAEKEDSEKIALLNPHLWRLWGRAAGLCSFGFYLLEYFPNHLSLRLEVNGPLYSIAAVITGEAFAQLTLWRTSDSIRERRSAWLAWMALSALLALVPASIVWGPVQWYSLRDPQMFRLHQVIEEFGPWVRFAGGWKPMLQELLKNFGILPALMIVAVILALKAPLRPHERIAVWLSSVNAWGIFVLSVLQMRWLDYLSVMCIVNCAVIIVCLQQLISRRFSDVIFVRLVTMLLWGAPVAQAAYFANRQAEEFRKIQSHRGLPAELLDAALNKRFAIAFRNSEGPGARVMATPELAPSLQYFAEASVVISLYWDNLDGLKAATGFFGATDFEQAKTLLKERRLTHVIVGSKKYSLAYLYYVANGASNPRSVEEMMASQLLGMSWLEPTPALGAVSLQSYTYQGVAIGPRWRALRFRP